MNTKASYYPFFKDVCIKFNCSVEDLETPKRGHRYVQAKRVCCRFLRLLGYSFPRISRILDKDHTSVINACKRCASDPDLEEYATELCLRYIQTNPDDKLIKKETFKRKIEHEKIITLFNQGAGVDRIAAAIDNTVEYVRVQLEYIRKIYEIKKIPDYKANKTREIINVNKRGKYGEKKNTA